MRFADVAGIMLGAGFGGGLRYILSSLIVWRTGSAFPWHTFVVNVSGAFLVGLLMAFTTEHAVMPESVRLMLAVGVLGGFTTFSTLSYESITLIERGLVAQGLANMFGSGMAGLAAVALGMYIGRAV